MSTSSHKCLVENQDNAESDEEKQEKYCDGVIPALFSSDFPQTFSLISFSHITLNKKKKNDATEFVS